MMVLVLMLVWDQCAGGAPADGYHVWHQAELGSTWELKATVTETSYPVVVYDQQGFYTVSSFNVAGESWAEWNAPPCETVIKTVVARSRFYMDVITGDPKAVPLVTPRLSTP